MNGHLRGLCDLAWPSDLLLVRELLLVRDLAWPSDLLPLSAVGRHTLGQLSPSRSKYMTRAMAFSLTCWPLGSHTSCALTRVALSAPSEGCALCPTLTWASGSAQVPVCEGREEGSSSGK
jgi:hypothetical protein